MVYRFAVLTFKESLNDPTPPPCSLPLFVDIYNALADLHHDSNCLGEIPYHLPPTQGMLNFIYTLILISSHLIIYDRKCEIKP